MADATDEEARNAGAGVGRGCPSGREAQQDDAPGASACYALGVRAAGDACPARPRRSGDSAGLHVAETLVDAGVVNDPHVEACLGEQVKGALHRSDDPPGAIPERAAS